jgi:hypothetical protein
VSWNNLDEFFFAKPPVNPNGPNDYLRIARTPFDFASIREKINGTIYFYVESFMVIVYLMFCNANYMFLAYTQDLIAMQ